MLEKDGNTSMLQSSGKNDELNKESSIPSLPASSSDLHLNSSSQEDLVQLLEKANMKIAHLEQSNSALSKKCQEVQIKLVDEKVIMEELQSLFQKRWSNVGNYRMINVIYSLHWKRRWLRIKNYRNLMPP